AFIGSRCGVVEGGRVGPEAGLGANVVIPSPTPGLHRRRADPVAVPGGGPHARGAEPVELRGEVPPRAVVVPGTRKKAFPAGDYRVPCALIIGERSASTGRKPSLTHARREHA